MATSVRSTSAILGVILGSILLAACGARGVHIADLRDRPTHYEHRTVSVHGTVTRAWGLPLVPFQFYSVDDGTGEITVLSNASRTPVRGARVRVKGQVNEVAVLGGRSIGLHLREEKRRAD